MNLSADQRTRIERSVLSGRNVPRLSRADFAVRVGTVVPRHVTIIDVPPTLVEINPAWRGNKFVVVEDEILIISPERRIVATVPVGGSSARVRGTTTIAIEQLPPDEIRIVQEALVRRGFRVEVTGRFDDRTRQALIDFKRRERLGASVELDTRTVSALGVQDRVRLQGSGETTGRAADQPGQERARGQGGDQDQGRAARGQERPDAGRDAERQRQGGAQQGGAARSSQQQPGNAGRSANEQQRGQEPGATTGQGSGMSSGQSPGRQQPAGAQQRQGGGAQQGGAAQERQERPEGSR